MILCTEMSLISPLTSPFFDKKKIHLKIIIIYLLISFDLINIEFVPVKLLMRQIYNKTLYMFIYIIVTHHMIIHHMIMYECLYYVIELGIIKQYVIMHVQHITWSWDICNVFVVFRRNGIKRGGESSSLLIHAKTKGGREGRQSPKSHTKKRTTSFRPSNHSSHVVPNISRTVIHGVVINQVTYIYIYIFVQQK